MDRFEEQGMAISENGTILAVIGFSEEPHVSRRLYISNDAGRNWRSPNGTLYAQYVASSNDLTYIYATIEPDNELLQKGQIVVSSDAGKTFQNVQLNYTEFYMFTSIASSASGQYVYATTFNTHGNGFVYRSDDYGLHFAEVP